MSEQATHVLIESLRSIARATSRDEREWLKCNPGIRVVGNDNPYPPEDHTCWRAADEIERLRNELIKVRGYA